MGLVRCWNSKFGGIECLECEFQFGFFKSPNDRRPSKCRWIDKLDNEFINEVQKSLLEIKF